MSQKRKAGVEARVGVATASPDRIDFHSRTPGFAWLSNFDGDAEIWYQWETKCAPGQPAARRLFATFASCDKAEFLDLLQRLQPGKKWTARKLAFWVRDGVPVRGILALLAARALCGRGAGSSKRLQALQAISQELSPVSPPIQLRTPELRVEQRIEVMVACLWGKFTEEPFCTRLLATGDMRLCHKPMRGTAEGSFWAGDGQVGWGVLGRLIEHVRAQLRERGGGGGDGAATRSAVHDTGHGGACGGGGESGDVIVLLDDE